jgi:threonine/homoserine/homoserine lactone efflux protein
MPEPRSIALFILTALPLCLTPGPGMLYVVSRAAAGGRRAAIPSSLGLSIGTLIHTLLIAFGVAELLANVPVAYDVLRFGGAAYLVWLGVKLCFARPSVMNEAPPPNRHLFLQGILTGTLNPKVALFLLAFLPQFVTPENGHVSLQILILGVLYEVTASIVNLSVGLTAGTAAAFFQRAAIRKGLERASGLVCIALGVRLALAKRA